MGQTGRTDGAEYLCKAEHELKEITLRWVILIAFLAAPAGAVAAELLVNGDFEIGAAQDYKASSFAARGWRRQLWRPGEWNVWLTDGSRTRQVGKGNKALQYRWGACRIYQVFSAAGGKEYNFSVDYYLGSRECRWQARIQVQWFGASDKPIGRITTVAEVINAKALTRKWSRLTGAASAPDGTAYGRIILNVNNRGAGRYFQGVYLDNASVTGAAGTHNLPVTFISSPGDLKLRAINESTPYKDSLTNYAEDKDADKLMFARISGPKWLNVKPDGAMTGTPKFADAGNNMLVVKVADGRGSSETRTLTIPVKGRLTLGNLFGDNMVLQRDAAFSVFGKAIANSPVRVAISSGEAAETKAGADGAWSVKLPALKVSAGGPVTMSIVSGPRTLVLKNLLVGDVWFCSGQSNMSWPMTYTDTAAREIKAASNPNLRMVKTPETVAASPWRDLDAPADWKAAGPKAVAQFSAVAYHFGKDLQRAVKIPIGLIQSSQGGSSIEPWASAMRPGGSKTLYNSRVHPYTRLPIKGVIWYQGEANVRDGARYTGKMKTLIADWRKQWGVGQFPFYFVQLAAFNYKGDAPHQLPELWAAQTAAAATIPNTAMAVITDVSDITNIHPRKKAPVGRRLALLARHGTYGEKNLVYSGPTLRAAKKEKDKVRVWFDHIGGGLASRDSHPINGFELAGADGKFVGAQAVIQRDTVVVSAAAVKNPAWVRFAWHETARSNLMNKQGLPANSFTKRLGATSRPPATDNSPASHADG
jgi:sialate O-acetylesterase